MMRVVVLPDGVRVVEAKTPEPGPGEVQLRMVVAGVCGSDTHALRGRHPNVHPPYAPGHEVVGVDAPLSFPAQLHVERYVMVAARTDGAAVTRLRIRPRRVDR